MGLSSTTIYTTELILCSTICVPSATRHNIHVNIKKAVQIVRHAELENRRVMSTANFSAVEKQITSCWSGLTTGPGINGPLIFISVLNIFLSITAVLGNALIIVGLHKDSSLHPPSKLLLRRLATTDLCAGLISEDSKIHFNRARSTTVKSLLGALRALCNISSYDWEDLFADELLLY